LRHLLGHGDEQRAVVEAHVRPDGGLQLLLAELPARNPPEPAPAVETAGSGSKRKRPAARQPSASFANDGLANAVAEASGPAHNTAAASSSSTPPSRSAERSRSFSLYASVRMEVAFEKVVPVSYDDLEAALPNPPGLDASHSEINKYVDEVADILEGKMQGSSPAFRYLLRHTHGNPLNVVSIMDLRCVEMYVEHLSDALTTTPYHHGHIDNPPNDSSLFNLKPGDICSKDCCNSSRGVDVFLYFSNCRIVLVGARDLMMDYFNPYVGPSAVFSAWMFQQPMIDSLGAAHRTHIPPAPDQYAHPNKRLRDKDQDWWSFFRSPQNPNATFQLAKGDERLWSDEPNVRHPALGVPIGRHRRYGDADFASPVRYVDVYRYIPAPLDVAASVALNTKYGLSGMQSPPLNGTPLDQDIISHLIAPPAGLPPKWSKSSICAFLFSVAYEWRQVAAKYPAAGGAGMTIPDRTSLFESARRLTILLLTHLLRRHDDKGPRGGPRIPQPELGRAQSTLSTLLVSVPSISYLPGAPVVPIWLQQARLVAYTAASNSSNQFVIMAATALQALCMSLQHDPNHFLDVLAAINNPPNRGYTAHAFLDVAKTASIIATTPPPVSQHLASQHSKPFNCMIGKGGAVNVINKFQAKLGPEMGWL